MSRIVIKSKNYLDTLREYSAYCIESGFVIDSENEVAITKICQVLSNRDRGTCIVGNTGSGKTILMQMLKEITHPQGKRAFVFKKCQDMVTAFNDSKETGYDVFSFFKNKNVCFDDLGTEDIGNYYGVKVEVFERIIQNRYDIFKSDGLLTHFTTNLGYQRLIDRYGSRCGSRIDEMCEYIPLGSSTQHKDRREYRNKFTLPKIQHIYKPNPEDKIMLDIYEAIKLNPTPLSSEIPNTAGKIVRERLGTSHISEIINTLLPKKELSDVSEETIQDILQEFQDLYNHNPIEINRGKIVTYLNKQLTASEFLDARINEMNNLNL